MITKRLIILSLIAAGVTACGKKEHTTETLAYHYKMNTFYLESSGGCTTDTVLCARYEITYPVFQGMPRAISDSLHSKISTAVDTGNPELDTLSFELAGKSFISDFEHTKKEMPDQARGWYYKSVVVVNILSDTLLSLQANNEYFTGGAHGGNGIYFINLQPSTGKTITLGDVLKPGFEEGLRKQGEVVFRKILAVEDTTSFIGEGFEFAKDTFTLNDNYGFTREGILFVFNVYEIAPYAQGLQKILIPYAKLKDWLK